MTIEAEIAYQPGWIGITQGPIRWASVSNTLASYYVSDSRVSIDSPEVRVTLEWEDEDGDQLIGFEWHQTDEDNHYSNAMAHYLSGVGEITEILISLKGGLKIALAVEAVPGDGCWVIKRSNWKTMDVTQQNWKCYQAIAKALLAMPMAESEVDTKAN